MKISKMRLLLAGSALSVGMTLPVNASADSVADMTANHRAPSSRFLLTQNI